MVWLDQHHWLVSTAIRLDQFNGALILFRKPGSQLNMAMLCLCWFHRSHLDRHGRDQIHQSIQQSVANYSVIGRAHSPKSFLVHCETGSNPTHCANFMHVFFLIIQQCFIGACCHRFIQVRYHKHSDGYVMFFIERITRWRICEDSSALAPPVSAWYGPLPKTSADICWQTASWTRRNQITQ